jgi:hypothetical protein
MKRFLPVTIVLLVFLGVGCAVFQRAKDDKRPSAVTPQPVATEPVTTIEDAPPPEAANIPEPPGQHEETTVATPVVYFPPPTLDLTGSKLGNQRVPGTDAIGDIQKIQFHDPTQSLFMTVIEKDGMRAVWRLDEQGKVERVFAANPYRGEIDIQIDRKGVLYVQYDNPWRLYRSKDGLKTWTEVAKDVGMFWQIADDGKGNVYGAMHEYNRAVLYRSQDDGFTWEAWRDFQRIFPEYAVTYDPSDTRYKLRHLHGLIVNDKTGAIIVGTGDVARFAFRSDDDGLTWRKIWDEGFTASVAMSGGNRYLLGPDQLHSHGIALYDVTRDTVKEVWNPIPHNYAGYTYSMINVDGIYYVAFHTEANEVTTVVPKSGVIVSPDGLRWYPFLEWSPLSNHARTNIWLTSAPSRVYASVNGLLYAFAPLDKTWFANRDPFPAK